MALHPAWGKFREDMVRFRRWLDDPEYRDQIEELQQKLDDIDRKDRD